MNRSVKQKVVASLLVHPHCIPQMADSRKLCNVVTCIALRPPVAAHTGKPTVTYLNVQRYVMFSVDTAIYTPIASTQRIKKLRFPPQLS